MYRQEQTDWVITGRRQLQHGGGTVTMQMSTVTRDYHGGDQICNEAVRYKDHRQRIVKMVILKLCLHTYLRTLSTVH